MTLRGQMEKRGVLRRAATTLGLVVSCGMLVGIDCGGNKDCLYGGTTYHDGDTFPSDDKCNTCSCANGTVACTARACVTTTWWKTCGDPVCKGHTADPNIPACTTEKVGDVCTTAGVKCDPIDDCNAHLVCANSDPTKQPGGCPISRAKYKQDIRYLDRDGEDRVRADLLRLRLATYHYKALPTGPEQLGFIIDDAVRDVGARAPVNADGETVNLYGYASMAVAAMKAQEREIAELRAEVKALKARLDGEGGRNGRR